MKMSSVCRGLALCLFLALGCRESREREVGDSPGEFGSAILSHESAQKLEKDLLRRLEGIKDDAKRQEAVRRLTRRLLDIPFADKPYSDQLQVMRSVSDLIANSVAYRCVRVDEPELRCEIRLSLVDWWRSQLARLG